MSQEVKTLISASRLLDELAGGSPPVIIDVGFDLADPEAGRRDWAAGHVPGSLYLHLDADLSGPKTGRNGRHPLPSREAFAALLGGLAIGPQTPVVVLDRQGAVYAARLWWMLRWMGHADVAVLDGGLAAWQAAGGEVSIDPAVARQALPPYPDRAPLMATIDAAALLHALGSRRVLDARAPERFRGEIEPLDAVAGHIPGATNRFFRANLHGDGRFKPAHALRAEFEALVGDGSLAPRVVHQCGSGVTACHNLLAMEHAGLPGSVLYAGSWSEWSADPSLPVAQG